MYLHEFNYFDSTARVTIYTSGLNLPLDKVKHKFIVFDGGKTQRQMYSANVVGRKVVDGIYTPSTGCYIEKLNRTNGIPEFVNVHMQSALNDAKKQLGDMGGYVDGLSVKYINQIWGLFT